MKSLQSWRSVVFLEALPVVFWAVTLITSQFHSISKSQSRCILVIWIHYDVPLNSYLLYISPTRSCITPSLLLLVIVLSETFSFVNVQFFRKSFLNHKTPSISCGFPPPRFQSSTIPPPPNMFHATSRNIYLAKGMEKTTAALGLRYPISRGSYQGH